MQLPASLAASFAQSPDEPLPMRVIVENRFALVSPLHYEVNRTGIFHSELAGHGPETVPHRLDMSISRTDPFQRKEELHVARFGLFERGLGQTHTARLDERLADLAA